MGRVLILTLLLLAAGNSLAAEDPAVPPDAYTRDSIMRVLRATEEQPVPRVREVHWGFGYVEFRALGQHWRLAYLPIMAPLSGTAFTTSRQWPDPFALTNTSIATTPRTFRQRVQVNRELRRIEAMERARVDVKARVE